MPNLCWNKIYLFSIHKTLSIFLLYSVYSLPFISQALSENETNNLICNDHQPCFTNSLIHENSPYLLQHAHNPINWYAWNETTLEKSRKQNKPIFLSIGYNACHWCQVMERESFNDLKIADILNRDFIAIKVDREQRADIDEFYGNAVMYLKGQQGWPMTVFLTPDAKPFNGGGYYSRDELEILLIQMSDYWINQQSKAITKADTIVKALQRNEKAIDNSQKIDRTIRLKAIKSLLSIFDSYQGGFGESSKFPREPWLSLLLDNSYSQTESGDSLIALRLSLSKMLEGGIHDQLAGGFHRYTIDPYWKIPHFEKMLYNQALLIRLYLRASVIQPDSLYSETARQTVDFLLTELQSPNAGFYSSLNAETEGEEGKYYLWSVADWNTSLDKTNRNLFSEYYDIDEYGETTNSKNVLYRSLPLIELSEEKNISLEELQTKLEETRRILLQKRNLRTKPEIDKKIIMSWNALTITALAEAYQHLNNSDYLNTAKNTANFIWQHMQTDQSFWRIHFNGKNSQIAQLEDYAYYLQALITLYDIDQNKLWIVRAKKITDIIINSYHDSNNGAFFNTPLKLQSSLPYRPKTAFDKTLPAANAVLAQTLVRLYRRTGDEQYLQLANEIFSVFSADVIETPSAFSTLLIAVNELHNGETDLPVYSARGHIRIDAFVKHNTNNNYNLTISIQIDDNWHINANQPLTKQSIPTSISLINKMHWSLSSVQYPESKIVETQFSKQPLALYQSDIIINAQLEKNNTKLNPKIMLMLQACNDKTCLAPESITLYPRLIKDFFGKNQ